MAAVAVRANWTMAISQALSGSATLRLTTTSRPTIAAKSDRHGRLSSTDGFGTTALRVGQPPGEELVDGFGADQRFGWRSEAGRGRGRRGGTVGRRALRGIRSGPRRRRLRRPRIGTAPLSSVGRTTSSDAGTHPGPAGLDDRCVLPDLSDRSRPVHGSSGWRRRPGSQRL